MTSWQLSFLCSLLREIERTRGRRYWPQGLSQQSSEGPRHGALFLEHLLKLNYHSAQSSDTVSSAMCTKADKLQGAKSLDFVAETISDKSKHASGQGKKLLRPIVSISAVEKTRWKTQSNKQNFVHVRTQKKEAVTPKRLNKTCLWVFESLGWRCGSTVACCGVSGTGSSSPGRYSMLA